MRLFINISLLIATLGLAACANTLDGLKKDSQRVTEKTQAVSQVISAP